jgi:hypothetical protein
MFVRLYGWPTGLISVAVTTYYLIGAVWVIAGPSRRRPS